HDDRSRVACETLVTTDLAVVAGEITTRAPLTRAIVDGLVRDVIRDIGYDNPAIGFAADTCQVICKIHAQSPNIAAGLDVGGAGAQGMMSGLACKATHPLMPLPIYLAPRLVERHADMRRKGELDFLRPDAKSQVTVEYNADGTPNRIHTVVLSTQHDETVMGQKNGQDYFADRAREILVEKLILPTLRDELKKEKRYNLLEGKDKPALVIPGEKPPRADD